MGDLSKNFNKSEFLCKCGCGAFVLREDLIYKLQKIRDRLGMPIMLTSGTRCAIHNREVSGVDTSPHLDGWAADIYCKNNFLLLKYAMQLFKRVGIAKGFIHVDIDPTKSQEVYWVYGPNR